MRGVVTITLYALNLFFWGSLFLVVTCFRAIPGSRKAVTPMLQRVLHMWVRGHSRITDLLLDVALEVRGLEGLSPDENYVIVANHRSWLDIPILERVLMKRVSFIRFFAKRELIWVPVVGAALWALEMPLLRRYPKELVAQRPELRRHDLETTRKACEQFGRGRSESLLCFLEGTRFTEAKRRAQSSPYLHLLQPKLGALSLVLVAIGDRLHSLLDVTIAYPGATDRIFWRFANGEIDRVIVEVSEYPIPSEFTASDFLESEEQRARFRAWIESLWFAKDESISR